MLLAYLFLVVAYIAFFWIFFVKLPKRPHEVISYLKEATQIYKDDKSSIIFSSQKYKIKAKPDFIYKLGDEYILVEYKSRNGSVKDSDVSQLIATALAVKETYPTIKYGFIYTNSHDVKKIHLDKSDDELANVIKEELNYVRAIENKKPLPFTPKKHKCEGCGYRQVCWYSVG